MPAAAESAPLLPVTPPSKSSAAAKTSRSVASSTPPPRRTAPASAASPASCVTPVESSFSHDEDSSRQDDEAGTQPQGYRLTFVYHLPFYLIMAALALALPRTSTIVLGAIFPLYLVTKCSPALQYYYRLAAFLLGLGTASVWGVVVSVVLSLLGQSHNINWVVARSFHGVVAPLVGVRFSVEGEHFLSTVRPAVVIGNHQTMIDILCTFT